MTYLPGRQGPSLYRGYGTGSDGALNFSGAWNASAIGGNDGNGVRIWNATTCIVNAGSTITMDVIRLVVKATTSIIISGTFDGVGRGNGGGSGGAGTTNGHGGAGSGPARGTGGQWSPTGGPGGGGGAGHMTNGGDGTTASSPVGLGGTKIERMALIGQFPWFGDTLVLQAAGGGGGGGGNGAPGQAGGAGGAGGALIILIAPSIVLNSGALFDMRGAAGTTTIPNAAGGGGGAGGLVYMIGQTVTFPGSGTVVNCTGGAGGGNGGGTGGVGGAGADGVAIVAGKQITAGYAARITGAAVVEFKA